MEPNQDTTNPFKAGEPTPQETKPKRLTVKQTVMKLIYTADSTTKKQANEAQKAEELTGKEANVLYLSLKGQQLGQMMVAFKEQLRLAVAALAEVDEKAAKELRSQYVEILM